MTSPFVADLGALGAGVELLSRTAEATVSTIGGADVEVGLHRHDRHDEYGVLVAGRGVLTIGDVEHEIGPGSAWMIPRGVPHGGRYDGEFRVLVWFTPEEDPAAPDRVELD